MADQPYRELMITRELAAPRESVWRAWTEPEMLAKWWGPQGVTNPECEVDARVGGRLYIVMLAGEELGPLAGQRWPTEGVFKELVKPSRIVFTNQAVDEAGCVMLDGLTTVEFEEMKGGRTKMTLHVAAKGLVPQAPQMLEGMEAGWTQSLEKLGEFLTKGR